MFHRYQRTAVAGEKQIENWGKGGGAILIGNHNVRVKHCKRKNKQFPFFWGGGGVSEQNINSTLRV